MSFQEIFTSKYLFNPIPPSQTNLFIPLLIFFSALVLLSIAIYFLKGWDLQIRMKQFYCFLTNGILGLIYLFARYESLPWLGSRIFLVLIILTLFIWITIILVWMFKYNRKLESKKILTERYEKYLPRSKKK